MTNRPPGLNADEALRWHGWTETPSGCWEWNSGTNLHGYGRIGMGHKVWLAHRLAYTTWVGPIPAGLVVRHACDNPPCINPAHLLTGTQRDNARDALARHRTARGERHGATKLTWDEVRAIRARHAAGVPRKQLAADYSVSLDSIHKIIQNRNWKESA